MKKRIFFILAVFLASQYNLYSEETPIGKILSVKGKAEMTLNPSGKKVLLNKGDFIYHNIIIKTYVNSQVLLEFKNGIQKLLLANSYCVLKEKSGETPSSQIIREIESMMVIGGIKASKKEDQMTWKEDSSKENQLKEQEKKISLSVIKKFESKQYYEIIQDSERNSTLLQNQKALSLIAFSYLRLGLPEKSKELFKKVKDTDISLTGIFLCWIEMGNTEEAKKIYLKLPPTANYYKKLGELIEGQ